MARIVLALGTSHSPALNTSLEEYIHHAERDRDRGWQLDKDGNRCSYEELLTRAHPSVRDQIRPEVLGARIEACFKGIAKLAATLQATPLDALIVVGDDQKEQYQEDNMPALLIYWGETIRNGVLPLPASAPDHWRRARQQFHEIEAPRDYPVASRLARHLIESLIDQEFDVSHSRRLSDEMGEGHAFGFVHRQLMGERIVPMVPVVLNTYYPPNQPRPRRCYALGRAIRKAVESWDGDARVGIVASGGLSHFTVDEELDTLVLDACRTKNAEALCNLPLNKLNSGNSEIRNWITVAGASEALSLTWSDYQPCYRSEAGTGCGMAFAIWS